MIEDRKSRPLRQTSLVQLAKKGIFIGLEDDAIDQEHGPHSSPHSAVLPTSVSAAHHTAAASYTRIKKNTGYLYIKNGHVYKSCGQKAGTKYLKCYNKNCKGTARIKEDQLIEIVISFIFCVFII